MDPGYAPFGIRTGTVFMSEKTPLLVYDYNKSTECNHASSNEGVHEATKFARERKAVDYSWHHRYSSSRVAVQDTIIEATFNRMKSSPPAGSRAKDSQLNGKSHNGVSENSRSAMSRNLALFTAGAMGAGKGYTMDHIRRYKLLSLPCMVEIDPDKFKQSLPEWSEYVRRDPLTAGTMCHKESCFLVELAQSHCLMSKFDFWVDGSLSDSQYYEQLFNMMRKDYPNYVIVLIHVSASDHTVMRRCERRGSFTGRRVPKESIQRSLSQSGASVTRLTHFADFALFVSNDDDGVPPKLLKCIHSRGTQVLDSPSWSVVNSLLDRCMHVT